MAHPLTTAHIQTKYNKIHSHFHLTMSLETIPKDSHKLMQYSIEQWFYHGPHTNLCNTVIMTIVSMKLFCLPATIEMFLPLYRSTNKSTVSLKALGSSNRVVMSWNMIPAHCDNN